MSIKKNFKCDEGFKLLNYKQFIRIDLYGIEHLIFNGATDVFKNVNCFLIEVNDNFQE